MAKEEGKERIQSSFEDRPATVFVGFVCLIYYYMHFSGGSASSGPVMRILPPFPPNYYVVLALLTVALQILVWKVLGHFAGKWYKVPRAYLFFACEFFLLTFAFSFLSWPIYYFLVKFGTLPLHPAGYQYPS